MRDNDNWANQIAVILRSSQRKTYAYPYNYFSLFSFLNPFSRWNAVKNMRVAIFSQLKKGISEGDTISFVSHSFGTYLVLRFIQKHHDEVPIGDVVFISSILNSGLPAQQVIGRCKRFTNFAGTKDWILILNNFLPFPSAGLAGRIGCKNYFSDRDNRDYFFECGHSSWFHPRNGVKNWFISGPLKNIFERKEVLSEVSRPKLQGWLVGLLNIQKLLLPLLLVFGFWIGEHLINFDKYEGPISQIILQSDTANPLSIQRLLNFQYDVVHNILGGDKTMFIEQRTKIFSRFLASNNTALVVPLKNSLNLISNDHAAVVSFPLVGLSDGPDDRDMKLIFSPFGYYEWNRSGRVIAAGQGAFDCGEAQVEYINIFGQLERRVYEFQGGISCDDFQDFSLRTATLGTSLNDRLLVVESGKEPRISSVLSVPVLNWFPLGDKSWLNFDAYEGLEFKQDGAGSFQEHFEQASNLELTYFDANRSEISSGSNTFFFLNTTNSIYHLIISPNLRSYSSESDIQADIEIQKYLNGSTILLQKCNFDICTIEPIPLPFDRRVADVSRVFINSEECALKVGFSNSQQTATISNVPHPCGKDLSDKQPAWSASNISFELLEDISGNFLKINANPIGPSNYSRIHFSNKLAELRCDPLTTNESSVRYYFDENSRLLFLFCGFGGLTIDADDGIVEERMFEVNHHNYSEFKDLLSSPDASVEVGDKFILYQTSVSSNSINQQEIIQVFRRLDAPINDRIIEVLDNILPNEHLDFSNAIDFFPRPILRRIADLPTQIVEADRCC